MTQQPLKYPHEAQMQFTTPIADKPYISDPAVRERIEKLEETLAQLIARFEQNQGEQSVSTDQEKGP